MTDISQTETEAIVQIIRRGQQSLDRHRRKLVFIKTVISKVPGKLTPEDKAAFKARIAKVKAEVTGYRNILSDIGRHHGHGPLDHTQEELGHVLDIALLAHQYRLGQIECDLTVKQGGLSAVPRSHIIDRIKSAISEVTKISGVTHNLFQLYDEEPSEQLELSSKRAALRHLNVVMRAYTGTAKNTPRYIEMADDLLKSPVTAEHGRNLRDAGALLETLRHEILFPSERTGLQPN